MKKSLIVTIPLALLVSAAPLTGMIMGCHQTTGSGSSTSTPDSTGSSSESEDSSSTSNSSSTSTEEVVYCRYYFNGIIPSDASKFVTVASNYELTISETYTPIPLAVIKAGQPTIAFVASHHYTYDRESWTDDDASK